MKLEGKIPNAHVIDLEFDIIEKAIYAATFGNGIWKLDFSSFLE